MTGAPLRRTLLALEARYMFDAAAVATGAEVLAQSVAAQQADAALDGGFDDPRAPAALPADGGHPADTGDAAPAELSGAPDPLSSPADELASTLAALPTAEPGAGPTLVFIDRNVPELSTLLEGLDPGAEVVLLDSSRDGLAQVADAVQGRSGIAAIHVISHGEPGELHLGSGRYDADSIAGHAPALAAIGAALTAEGDLLFYGCDLGQGHEGEQLVAALAALTGADVAASLDRTGAAAAGGDWVLEQRSGSIEAGSALTASGQAAFQGLLVVAPEGNDATLAATEDTPRVLTAADFGFTDPAETAGPDDFAGVRIASLPATGSLQLNGAAVAADQVISSADIAAGLLRWVPPTDANGTGLGAFGFHVQDDGSGTTEDPTANTLQFDVAAVNDAPVLDLNSATGSTSGTNAGRDWEATFTEGGAGTPIADGAGSGDADEASIGDLDNTELVSGQIVLTNKQPEDFLSIGGTALADGARGSFNGIGYSVADSGSAITISLTGTASRADYLTLIQSTTFGNRSETPNVAVRRDITVQVSDGTAASNLAHARITVVSVTDPSINVVPGAQSTAEDNALVFSAANGNAIAVTHLDQGRQTITLSATHGTLTLGGTAGLSFTAGDGTADSSMTFSGSFAQINAALDGLRFAPDGDYSGPAQITMRAEPALTSWVNGGFEQPDSPSHVLYPENQVPGWDTDATDGMIEVWQHGAQGVPAFEGEQFAEINGNFAAALFQDFRAEAGAPLSVSFAHRGRLGTDIMNVRVTDLGPNGLFGDADDTVLLNENFSDGQAWREYTRPLTGSASGNLIRFEFRAISSSGGNNAIGNFVDGIQIRTNLGDTDTIDITVTPQPETVPDNVATRVNTPFSFNVLTGAGGASADLFRDPSRTVTAITQPAQSQVSFAADGTMRYTPPLDFIGITTFSYTVTVNGETHTETVTVSVRPPPVPPVLDLDASGSGTGFAASYTEDGPGVALVDADVSVIDADSPNLAAASFFIANGQPGDVLAIAGTLPAGITASYDPASFTLTLSGAATPADYQAALALVRFSSTSNTPSTVPRSIEVTVSDGQLTSNTAIATVAISAVNDTPQASSPPLPNLRYDDGQGVRLPVAQGFDDPDGDTLTYTATGLPPGLAIDPVTGEITGTVAADASGPSGQQPYNVVVTATDPSGASATQSFDLTITNPAPGAVDDTAGTLEDTAVRIDVLANDIDPEGDALQVTQVEGQPLTVGGPAVAVQGGSVQLVLDASGAQRLEFTPAPNYHGSAVFSYTVADTGGNASQANVVVDVAARNDPPVPAADSATTREGTQAHGWLLNNDSDADGDPLRVTGFTVGGITATAGQTVTLPGVGTLTIDADGRYSFVPAPNYSGTLPPVSYTVSDGTASASATLQLSVTPVNDVPTLGGLNDGPAGSNADAQIDERILATGGSVSGSFSVASVEGVARLTIGGVDIGLTGLTQPIDIPGPHGTLTVTGYDPATGIVSYRYALSGPVDHSAGPVQAVFTVQVTDSDGDTVQAGLRIDIVDDAPQAVDDAATVADPTSATAVAGSVLANDTGSADSVLAVSGVAAGSGAPAAGGVGTPVAGQYGTLLLQADGSYSYQFDPAGAGQPLQSGQPLTEVFTYQVADADGDLSTATLTVTIPSVVQIDLASTPEDQPALGNVLANDRGGNTLLALTQFEVDGVVTPAGGTATIAGVGTLTLLANGDYTFVPAPHYHGPVPVATYTASSGSADFTAELAITVTPVNDLPTASADPATTPEDTPVQGTVTAADADGDALSFTTGTAPAHGTVALAPDGSYTYTPDPDYHGADSFTVVVSDGQGGSHTVTVPVQVTPVNDPPAATPDLLPPTLGGTVRIDVLANDADPDGDALAVTHIDGQPIAVGASVAVEGGRVLLNADGTLGFTPDLAYAGTPRFSYTVADPGGASAIGTVLGVRMEAPIAPILPAAPFEPDEPARSAAHAGDEEDEDEVVARIPYQSSRYEERYDLLRPAHRPLVLDVAPYVIDAMNVIRPLNGNFSLVVRKPLSFSLNDMRSLNGTLTLSDTPTPLLDVARDASQRMRILDDMQALFSRTADAALLQALDPAGRIVLPAAPPAEAAPLFSEQVARQAQGLGEEMDRLAAALAESGTSGTSEMPVSAQAAQ